MNLGSVLRGAVALVAVLVAGGGVRADTPAETDAQFFMLLAHKQVATLGDGYQAVAMLVRGDSKVADAAECRKLLRERKVARASWGDDLAKPLTKGKLAYMVCQALGIKGGLTMRLLGPSERYCLFECQYLELMATGTPYQHCAGGELVSVVDRADAYKREESGEAAAQEQPAADTEKKETAAGEKPANRRPSAKAGAVKAGPSAARAPTAEEPAVIEVEPVPADAEAGQGGSAKQPK